MACWCRRNPRSPRSQAFTSTRAMQGGGAGVKTTPRIENNGSGRLQIARTSSSNVPRSSRRSAGRRPQQTGKNNFPGLKAGFVAFAWESSAAAQSAGESNGAGRGSFNRASFLSFPATATRGRVPPRVADYQGR
jgi:hypothetical protein